MNHNESTVNSINFEFLISLKKEHTPQPLGRVETIPDIQTAWDFGALHGEVSVYNLVCSYTMCVCLLAR